MMFSKTLIFCLLAVLAFSEVNASHHRQEVESRLNELESELEMILQGGQANSRLRRAPMPRPGDVRKCGREMQKFVVQTCGGPCSAFKPIDIATQCCTKQCTYELVKEACCPDNNQ